MTDSNSTLDQLAARLDAQEAELTRLRSGSKRAGWLRFGAGALVASAAMVTMGQAAPPPKALTAESFVLINKEGKVCGGIGQSGKGAAGMWLQDPQTGKKRIHMMVTKEGVPSVLLHDKAGTTRISMGVAKNGLSFMAINDDRGKIRNFMFVDQNGNPSTRLKDAEGKNMTKLP